MNIRFAGGLVTFEVADDSLVALELTRKGLVSDFAARHAEYPQYDGFFAEARLVRVGRKIRTKGGLAFEKGELAIAIVSPEVRMNGTVALEEGWTVYSPARGWNVHLAQRDVETVL